MSRNGSSAQETRDLGKIQGGRGGGDPVVDEPPSPDCTLQPPCHRYPVIRIAGVPSGVWVWLAVGDDKVAGSVSVSCGVLDCSLNQEQGAIEARISRTLKDKRRHNQTNLDAPSSEREETTETDKLVDMHLAGDVAVAQRLSSPDPVLDSARPS